MSKYNGDKGKRINNISATTTKSIPSPADYPLGSVESRAAARAMMDTKKEDGRLRGIHIIYVDVDAEGNRTEYEGPWIEVPPVNTK